MGRGSYLGGNTVLTQQPKAYEGQLERDAVNAKKRAKREQEHYDRMKSDPEYRRAFRLSAATGEKTLTVSAPFLKGDNSRENNVPRFLLADPTTLSEPRSQSAPKNQLLRMAQSKSVQLFFSLFSFRSA